MSTNNLNVDINSEIDILTPRSAAQLIISIFEVLLFQRNQIPFMFRTFSYFISKWKLLDENDCDISNFNVHRQRKSALTTLKQIKKLKEIIKETFKSNNEILSVRFLFGTTPQLPKEIYHLKIPFVSKSHSDEVHLCSVEPMITTTLRTLLTSEKLYKLFSTTLLPTNVFLDVEFKYKNEIWESDNLTLKDIVEFPPSCKQIVLNLNIKPSNHIKNYECCKNLNIFVDDNSDVANSLTTDTNLINKINWWETKYSVKGFKENNMTKSLNIWNEDN